MQRLPAPINRLPNELLLNILDLAIHAATELELTRTSKAHDWKMEVLMKVSRHWRNIIPHCPILMEHHRCPTKLGVSPSWNRLQLKAHVERSRPSLVDIEIRGCWTTERSDANEFLDIVALCAGRWRSLSETTPPASLSCLRVNLWVSRS